jgi:hypothetical protein
MPSIDEPRRWTGCRPQSRRIATRNARGALEGLGTLLDGQANALAHRTWGMRGAFNHNWDPYWYSALYGAYAQLKYGDAGAALICGALAGFGPTAGITSCNPDFNVAQIGVNTHWTPGEESDVLGRRHLYPSRPEACWNDCSRSKHRTDSEAGSGVRAEGPRYRDPAAPCSTQLLAKFA